MEASAVPCEVQYILIAMPLPMAGARQLQKKPRKHSTEERRDKLDSMVARYKAQLFGGGEGSAGRKGFKDELKRWFE
jgi:hypothetical protein